MKMLVEEIDMHKISSVKNIKTKGGKTVQSEQKSKQHAMENHHKVNVKCSRCGYQHEYTKCPAYGQICKACNKRNHFAKMCRKQVSTRKIQTVEQSDEQDDFFVETTDVQTTQIMENVHTVITETQNEKDKWTESLKINNKNITFKLDTGAACNVIPNNVFKSLETHRLHLHCRS